LLIDPSNLNGLLIGANAAESSGAFLMTNYNQDDNL
jgi:hypothetical protein